MIIKEIIIESESKGPIIGGTKSINDNSDIEVIFENGERFIATAFTYKNIEWLRAKNKKTGECLNGKYFWASDMFIVEEINRQTIEEVIHELISSGYFEEIFRKINSL